MSDPSDFYTNNPYNTSYGPFVDPVSRCRVTSRDSRPRNHAPCFVSRHFNNLNTGNEWFLGVMMARYLLTL
jgi:hypothetical protein